jgi:hypothetical protein
VLADHAAFLKQLKKDVEAGLADIKAGRFLGLFDSAEEVARALNIPWRRAGSRRRAPFRGRC